MTTSQLEPTARSTPAATGHAAQAGPASPPAPAPRPRRRPRVRLIGPARLVTQCAAALLAVAALCAAAVAGTVLVGGDVRDLRSAVDDRAAAAAGLHFALADLDAQRADELVPGHAVDSPDVPVGNRLLALITANQRRTEISGLMRQLAADPAQRDRVQQVFDALGRYDELSGRAGYADDQDANRPAGHPPAAAVDLSDQAGAVMRDQLLPAVDTLTQTYQSQAAALQHTTDVEAARAAVTVGALGVAALAVLLWWQRDLAVRYRRRINPPLAAAALAVAAVTLAATTGLVSAASAVDDAGSGGLQPWSRLAEARTAAADAAAAQSRWFVQDPGAAASYQDEYDTQNRRLDGLLAPGPAAGAAELTQYQAIAKPLAAFRADDGTLRQLVAAGQLDRAAVVLTEVGRDHVAFDYWDFATRLDSLEQARRADFVTRMDAARSALDGWPALPAAALGTAALLVLAGVRPRLVEYR